MGCLCCIKVGANWRTILGRGIFFHPVCDMGLLRSAPVIPLAQIGKAHVTLFWPMMEVGIRPALLQMVASPSWTRSASLFTSSCPETPPPHSQLALHHPFLSPALARTHTLPQGLDPASLGYAETLALLISELAQNLWHVCVT